MAITTPGPQPHAKLLNATDDFIAETLPDWLRRASAEQLAVLRRCFRRHRDSQQQLRDALRALQPLASFAKARLSPPLNTLVGHDVDLERAQWRQRTLVFEPTYNRTEFRNFYSDALERFMQNFEQGASFRPGSALVYTHAQASDRVLSTQTGQIASLCRSIDIGGQYQRHLSEVFDDGFTQVLADERRRQLALVTQIASLKGQLAPNDVRMLQRVIDGQPVSHTSSATVACGELTLLGARVEGALAFELRGSWGYQGAGATLPSTKGVILYLPDDREQALHQYADWRSASLALGLKMRTASYRTAIERRIPLADRAAYLATLGQRLKDPQTDMHASLAAVSGELFAGVAGRHLQRIRDDARFMAVPSAEVDAAVSSARLNALETAGLTLLNLAAFFVPGVGEVLLADLVRRTLTDTFEGVEDWSQGHQHEALEHLLNVAQTVVVTGTTVVGASLVRSAFVDHLVPVNTAQGQRLWQADLARYVDQAPPDGLLEQDNGFWSDGHDYWWRSLEGVHYRVRPAQARSAWQLCHPSRDSAYAPWLESNGERAWRLASERPLEWQGERLLLSRLWPAVQDYEEGRISDMLTVAGADQPLLRGLLVEHRPLPIALRDTLERFAVDARIETFVGQLQGGHVTDTALLRWCIDVLALGGETPQAQYAQIQAYASAVRGPMLEHFAGRYLHRDPQLALLKRDFPGLPDAYALDLLARVSEEERGRMIAESRLPLAVAERARAQLRLAGLVRMREGLYLRGSYRAETTELVFALLRRNARLPFSVNLELREGNDAGRVLARLHPTSGMGQATFILVWRDGRFSVYGQDGRAADIELAEPGGLPEVLVACLPEVHRQRLGWIGNQASAKVLADLRTWLPKGDQALTRLVGLREIRPWHVPPLRQVNGRLGYPLNGRRSSQVVSEQVLRDRVRALYSGFSDSDVDRFVDLLMEQPHSAFANLLIHEQAYQRLDETLQLWVAAEHDIAQQGLRRLVANQLRRSWRLEGDMLPAAVGEPEGRRLSLMGIPVGSLPALPPGADFGHVTDLILVGLRLQALPQDFLRCFPALRRLNLSNNALRQMPAGIDRLDSLHTLNLARNQIRMNPAGARVLRHLGGVRTLDLSANPLGSISLSFQRMPHLREISLRRTGLQAVPEGLQWCGFLEYADLRDNQIARVPQALYDLPLDIRQNLDFAGNPLPVLVRQRLFAPAAARGRGERRYSLPAMEINDDGFEGVREQWLATQAQDLRVRLTEQWQALRAESGSEGLFQLLRELTESSDYRRVPEDLGRRVWEVIETATQDTTLRAELFNLAGSDRTCVDSVASCFSALEVRVSVYRILRDTPALRTRPALLELARRLFRLDQVERLARADIERRQAEGREVDEIEVSLAYRVGLRDELDLPGQPQTMQFSRIAEVSRAQLERMAAQVRAEEAGGALVEYVGQRDFWVEYLHAQYPTEFEVAEAPSWRQLETLGDGQDLADDAYRQRIEQIASDRRKAQQDLVLRLTQEALNGGQTSHPD